MKYLQYFQKSKYSSALSAIQLGRSCIPDKAVGLIKPLRSLPWWSANSVNFPLLLKASGTPPTANCLASLAFPSENRWPNYAYMDKFGLLCILLSSAAEPLNAPENLGGNVAHRQGLEKRKEQTRLHLHYFVDLIKEECRANDVAPVPVDVMLLDTLPDPKDDNVKGNLSGSDKGDGPLNASQLVTSHGAEVDRQPAENNLEFPGSDLNDNVGKSTENEKGLNRKRTEAGPSKKRKEVSYSDSEADMEQEVKRSPQKKRPVQRYGREAELSTKTSGQTIQRSPVKKGHGR